MFNIILFFKTYVSNKLSKVAVLNILRTSICIHSRIWIKPLRLGNKTAKPLFLFDLRNYTNYLNSHLNYKTTIR